MDEALDQRELDRVAVAKAALLKKLRSYKLLKWLFHEDADTENHPIGYVDGPIDLETQDEIAEALVAAVWSEAKPVAWLHTMHMEFGQTRERLLDHDGTDPDEPSRTAFGIPGRDYSKEYRVTSEPLYRIARDTLTRLGEQRNGEG